MKEIVLASGDLTQVSDEDFDFLNRWSWSLSGSRGKPYPSRRERKTGCILMHHVIVERMSLVIPPGYEPDHKDRNPSNNQRDNLRVITLSQNRHNTDTQHNNTSGVRGVNFNYKINRWQARISVRSNRMHLGYFLTFEAAVEAREKAEKRFKVHG